MMMIQVFKISKLEIKKNYSSGLNGSKFNIRKNL